MTIAATAAGAGLRKQPEPGERASHDRNRPTYGRPATAIAAAR